MATATRQRSRATVVNQDNVGQANTLLQELPQKPKADLSLKEAVRQMQVALRAALAKGYSYQDLATLLNEQGIKISALTLKNYLPSGKRPVTRGKRSIRSSQKDVSVIQPPSLADTTTPETVETVDKTAPQAKRGRPPKSSAAKAASQAETGTATTSGRKKSASKKA